MYNTTLIMSGKILPENKSGAYLCLIVTAQLNLDSSWERKSNQLDYPVKLVRHFQTTYKADFWYATLF